MVVPIEILFLVQIKIIECVQGYSASLSPALSILTTFQFPARAVGFESETKRLFCRVSAPIGSITNVQINISHIRYAELVCGISLYEERASVGCQMMSLLIFYRLTQLFRDTQFKYLRWRRFKYQKQTRPC